MCIWFFILTLLHFFNVKGQFVFHGINFLNGEWSVPKYDTTDAKNEIVNIYKQTGNNCIQLTFGWYQKTINDTLIYKNDTSTPTDSELLSIANYTNLFLGCVVLRPTIIILNNNNGQDTHRDIGKYFIENEQWNLWFSNYTYFINYYANLSKQINSYTHQYVIGRELVYTTQQNDQWLKLIDNIKTNSLYKGKLRYDAMSGNENNVKFWSELDYIGIDAYYSLVNNTLSPTLDELINAWKPIASSLKSLHKQYNKYIIFGEVGYCSNHGTNIDPYKCLQSNQSLDINAQTNCYDAFFEGLWTQVPNYGVFFWSWHTDPNDKGNENKGYTINGKNAAGLVRYYWG